MKELTINCEILGENTYKAIYRSIIQKMSNDLLEMLSEEDGISPEEDSLPDELRILGIRIMELHGVTK